MSTLVQADRLQPAVIKVIFALDVEFVQDEHLRILDGSEVIYVEHHCALGSCRSLLVLAKIHKGRGALSSHFQDQHQVCLGLLVATMLREGFRGNILFYECLALIFDES